MYWTKPLLGAWVWVLIGEWERNGKNKLVSNSRDVHGALRFGVFRTPAFAKCGGARPTVPGCDSHKSTPLLRLEALEFLERAIWIRERSIMKCLEWSVKSELEVAP